MERRWTRAIPVAAIALAVIGAACTRSTNGDGGEVLTPADESPLPIASVGASPQSSTTEGTPPHSSSTTNQSINMPLTTLDLAALPLGSQKYSTGPETGYEYVCHEPAGGPPVTVPPWVDTDASTWNLTTKDGVEGDVRWKTNISIRQEGDLQIVEGNGLPASSGIFPVATSDPAHAYNPDPNAVFEHTVKVSLPYDPEVADSVTCVAGTSGIMMDGIPMLDGFDAGGYDAAAIETQDTCHGHPNDIAGYHYHSLSPCLLDAASEKEATLLGWAWDGFGLYVEYDDEGNLLTNADLDGCHGRASAVPWHGKIQKIYHYVLTMEFPYSVGCFRGTPASVDDVTGVGYMTADSGPPTEATGSQ